MSRKYILNEHGQAEAAGDLSAWAKWFETADRIVAQEDIGLSRISTVFLGIDHNFGPRREPILWETMVFGGRLNNEQDRCGGNREQAEAMHERMKRRVLAENVVV